MAPEKGMIVLMGSGELTATMVEVHKELLGRFGPSANAVFLDTPAGFQLNVDQISKKAQDYFQSHISQPLAIASYKSADTISPFEFFPFHTIVIPDLIRDPDVWIPAFAGMTFELFAGMTETNSPLKV